MSTPGVFVTDFGLAKNVATGSKFTRTGTTLGTPAYMSPELARGNLATVTAANDVWALGCVLYELLTGTPAFDGPTPAAVIAAVLTGPLPDPARAHGALPDAVRELANGALQRPLDHRPRDAGAWRDDCNRVLAGDRPLVRRRRSARGPLIAAVAVAAAAVAVGAWWASRPGAAAGSGGAAAAAPVPGVPGTAQAAQAWDLRSRDPARAVELFTEALALSPKQHEWRLQLGLVLWSTGRPDDAAAHWAAVPEDAPLFRRAALYLGLERFTRALLEERPVPGIREALQLAADGDDAVGRIAQAAVCHVGASADPERALDLVRDLPGWEAALIRGQSHMRLPRPDWAAAVAEYDRVIADGLPFWFVFVNRGIAKQQLQDYAGAVADLAPVVADRPRDVSLLHSYGIALRGTGDRAGALEAFDRALQADPDDYESHYQRGKTLLDLRRDAEAIRALHRCTQADPADGRPWSSLAIAHVRGGRVREALAAVDRGLALGGENAYDLVIRARLCDQLGDVAGAETAFARAIALAPTDADVRITRGIARVRRGPLEDGMADLDAGLALEPSHGEGLRERAMGWSLQGKFERALTDARRAVIALPNDWAAHAIRGQAAAKLRLWDEAVAAYRTSLRLAPGQPGAAETRRDLAVCEAQAAAQRK